MSIYPTGLDPNLPPAPTPTPSPFGSMPDLWDSQYMINQTPRRRGLNSLIPSLATASMSDIEEEIKKIQQQKLEEEIKRIQRQNSDTIARRRASSYRRAPKGDVHIIKVIRKLPKIREKMGKSLVQLVRLAEKAPGEVIHVGKKNVALNKTGYSITFSLKSGIYVHVPDSAFTSGGEAEIRLAIEAYSEECVVVSKRLDEDYSGAGSSTEDKLKKVLGDRRVMGRCQGCVNLAIPYAVTFKETVERVMENLHHAGNDLVHRRYVYTISKYYSGGDLDQQVFEGRKLYDILIGVGKGLKRLHKEGLIHHDLKPENVLYDGENPVIADFGSVGAVEDLMGKPIGSRKKFTRVTEGTSAYKPPESDKSMHKIDVMKDEPEGASDYYEREVTPYEQRYYLKYAKKGDIFSFGVCMFQWSHHCCDLTAERRDRHLQLVNAVTAFRREPRPDSGLDAVIYDTLVSNVEKRPTIEEVLSELYRLRRYYPLAFNSPGMHRVVSPRGVR